MSFKQENDFEERKAEADRIRSKFPERVPVIVEKDPRSSAPDIDKKKYLIPSDLTVGQFVYVIRKRLKLPAEQAIYLFIDNQTPPNATLLSTIYSEKCDADGFLFIKFSSENTFG